MDVVVWMLGSIAYWVIIGTILGGYLWLITGDESLGFVWKYHGWVGKLAIIAFFIVPVICMAVYIFGTLQYFGGDPYELRPE